MDEESKDSVDSNNKIKFQQDFDYISNDPEENADNFDPKWASFRELSTDEERYQAIRKRWGNSDIPDPSSNLTCRQAKNHSREGSSTRSALSEKNYFPTVEGDSGKKCRQPRRSRSCTRSYENLISNLEKNYYVEYCQLVFRQKSELQEMLQTQLMQAIVACPLGYSDLEYMMRKNIQNQQEQQVVHLLSNHYQQIRSFIGEKTENIEACKRYMDEVTAFFTFYQKINDSEVTLQMTDDQYEHTLETERMYSLFNRFYN